MKRIFAAVLVCILCLAGCASEKETDNADGTEAPVLTLEKVRELAAEKGEELTWDDFAQYPSEDIGSGLHVYRYEVDQDYEVLIGGGDLESQPLYIRFALREDTDKAIDIREESIDDFLASQE